MRNDRIISLLLSLAIAVVFVLFITFGISTFYKAPLQEDYCNNTIEPEVCSTDINETCSSTDCESSFEKAKNTYSLVIFVVMTLLGLAAVIASFFIPFESISTGAISGGLLSIFIGAVRAAGNFKDWMIFIILGVILAALVWIGYKKLQK